MQLQYTGSQPYTKAKVLIPSRNKLDLDILGTIPRIIKDEDVVNAVTRASNRHRHWLPNEEQVDTETTDAYEEQPAQRAASTAGTEQEQTHAPHDDDISRDGDDTHSQGEQSDADTDSQHDQDAIAPNEGETSKEPSSNTRSYTPEQSNTNANSDPNTRTTRPPPKANIHDWHKRLGHLSKTQIRKLQQGGAIRITKEPGQQGACDICNQSKAVKKPSRERMPETIRPFERFYFDLIGG